MNTQSSSLSLLLKRQFLTPLLAFLAVAGVLALAPRVNAATYTWNAASGNSNWNVSTDWASVAGIDYPGQTGNDVADFIAPGSLNTTANLTASDTIFQVLFSASNAAGYTIQSTGEYTLNLTSGITGASSAISGTNTSGVNTISVNVNDPDVSGNWGMVQSGGGILVISGTLSGTNSGENVILGNGAAYNGLIEFTNPYNTYTGNTEIVAEYLQIPDQASLGKGGNTVSFQVGTGGAQANLELNYSTSVGGFTAPITATGAWGLDVTAGNTAYVSPAAYNNPSQASATFYAGQFIASMTTPTGTLKLSANSQFGTDLYVVGGVLDLNGFNQTANYLNVGQNGGSGSDTGVVTNSLSSLSTLTVTGTFIGQNNRIQVLGDLALVLNTKGPAALTSSPNGGSFGWVGGLYILSGTWSAANNTSSAYLGSGNVYLGSTTGSGTDVIIGSYGRAFGNPIVVQAGNTGVNEISYDNVVVVTNNTSQAYTGALTLNNNLTVVASTTATNDMQFTGATTGTGNIIIIGGVVQIAGKSTGGITQLAGSSAPYTGSVIVTGGTLEIGAANALNVNNTVSIGTGAFLDLNTSGEFYGSNGVISPTIAGLSNYLSTAGSVTNSNTTATNVGTLTLGGAGSYSFGGVITNGVAPLNLTVAMPGAGSQTLTGAATYTGTTSVNLGTLDIGGFGTTGSISSSSPLALGGGTLNLTRTDSAGATQTFASTAINPGASTINVIGNPGDVLALQTITRNVGGTVNVNPVLGGVTTTTSNLSNSVLIGGALGAAYASVSGTDWASVSSGAIVPLSLVASYSTGNPAYNTATNNIDVQNGDSPSSAFTVNTLRLNSNSSGVNVLTLPAGANIVSTGGILVTPAVTSGAITGGTLESGSSQELVILNNGGLNIASTIADSANGSSALTISGPGTTTLSASNTYTGATYISGGALQLNNAGAVSSGTLSVNDAGVVTENTANGLGNTAGLALNYGSVTLSANNNYTGATTVTGGTLQLSSASAIGFSALKLNGGTLQLRGDTNNTTFADSSTSIAGNVDIDVDKLSAGASNNTLSLGNISTGNTASTVTFSNNNGATAYNLSVGTVTSGATGMVFNNNMVSGTTTFAALTGTAGATQSFNFNESAASSVTSIGPITSSTNLGFSVGQSGPGTLVMTGKNTFGSSNTSSVVSVTGGALIVTGTLNTRPELVNVSGVTGALLSLQDSGALSSGTVTLANLYNLNTSNGASVGGGGGLVETAANALSGVATSLVVSGYAAVANLSQANNYTGATTLNNGVLLLSNAGAIASSALTLTGGVLQLRNDTNTTTFTDTSTTIAGNVIIDVDKASAGASGNTLNLGNVNVGANIVTLTNNSGATGYNLGLGTVTTGSSTSFVNNMINGTATLAALTGTGAGPFTVSFDGTAGAVTSVGAITQNGANALGVSQIGATTLQLTGANTYTGLTTITSGTLQLGNGGSTGSLSPSSAIFDYAALVFDESGGLTQGANFGTAAITGTGTLVQAGGGTLTLNAANTYTGVTKVAAGRLIVTGSLTGGGAASVAAGATLGGSGSIGSILSVSGTLAPGTGLSTAGTTLSIGNNVTFNSGSQFVVNLDDPNDKADSLSISGNLAIDNTDTLTVNLVNGSITSNNTYILATVTGSFPGGALPTLAVTGGSLNGDTLQEVGGNLELVAAVPEPGTWAMLLSGAALLCVYHRRRGAMR